jgi:hypothetical protein
LLAEIVIIGALIYLGWEQPFKERLPWIKSEASKSEAAIARLPLRTSAKITPTPSGRWMWDPAHKSALDRPSPH